VRNQPEAAIEALERARRLSPFDPLAHRIALAHLVARRFEQAIEWADRARHDQPRLVSAMRVKAVVNDHLGRLEQRFELACVYRLLPTPGSLTESRSIGQWSILGEPSWKMFRYPDDSTFSRP